MKPATYPVSVTFQNSVLFTANLSGEILAIAANLDLINYTEIGPCINQSVFIELIKGTVSKIVADELSAVEFE